jgi:dipeptidyl aminopeptidase/acylaminoacyl peptidase
MRRDPKHSARCGTWISTLTAEDMTGSTIGLGSVSADGEVLYWLESRPMEQGRSALVRRLADRSVSDVTPPPFNVATRVHEYGGGAYAVSNGRIVFSDKADGAVWLIEDDGVPEKIVAVDGCRYADFRFVPGTSAVVCVREDHRNRPGTDPEAAIVLLDIASGADPSGNKGTVLTRGADFYASPRPSPDGRRIAWLSWDHPDMPWDATQLHVARLLPSGLADVEIVAGTDQREAIVQPEWSPTGILHFCTDRSAWWNVHRVAANGGIEPVTSVSDGEIGGPHWMFGQRYFDFQPDGGPDGGILAALSRGGVVQAVAVEDGKVRDLGLPPVQQCPVNFPGPGGVLSMAYVSAAPDTPQVVRISLPKDGALTHEVIRSSGPVLLAADDVSAGEPISFPTADGEAAYSFFYAPVNSAFEPLNGEKPPLVVMIHGGPTAMARSGFSLQTNWWTTRGFAVVDVNYRGSTGFGRNYRRKLDGNWGVADVEDCIAAVEHLVAGGRVDPDRIAIRGGSAGGFTALAALTLSAVFKAGASLYGIGDLMLLARETHKFESRYMDRLVGPLPEAAAVFARRSPINHLDRMTAGAIFFQGLDDKVVPPSQAADMVAAMRGRGLPVAHYTFEGEGHGFRRAETIRRVLELELGFYGRLFGFEPPGLSETVEILS